MVMESYTQNPSSIEAATLHGFDAMDYLCALPSFPLRRGYEVHELLQNCTKESRSAP